MGWRARTEQLTHPSQDDNTPATEVQLPVSQKQMNREQGDRTTKAARLGISQISPSDAIPSAAVCAIRKKKHNVNEWETGNRLNPCLDTVMSACKQRLSSREPLSAVTTRLRDAFLFWLASLLLVRSLITGAGRMKALPDTVDSLQTRR